MCACAGEKCGCRKDGATMLLAQQLDFGVFGDLCEEVEALHALYARERKLGKYWACIAVLKLCIFDLLRASSRLLLLAKAPKHPKIQLLRQQHRSTVFAPVAFLSYARTHKTTL